VKRAMSVALAGAGRSSAAGIHRAMQNPATPAKPTYAGTAVGRGLRLEPILGMLGE
jgi:hypothetical protein